MNSAFEAAIKALDDAATTCRQNAAAQQREADMCTSGATELRRLATDPAALGAQPAVAADPAPSPSSDPAATAAAAALAAPVVVDRLAAAIASGLIPSGVPFAPRSAG